MSALPVESARLSKVRILCLNDLLDGDLCKKIFIICICLFFWFSSLIFLDALILPVSQLQTQRVMMSQIRSHIHNADLLYSSAQFVVEMIIP